MWPAADKNNFEKHHQVSVTLDDSSVRGLELCNCPIVEPDGIAACAPTQVAQIHVGYPA